MGCAKIKSPARFTFGLNLFAIYLLIYPTFTIVWNVFQQLEANHAISTIISSRSAHADQPDIYYIILDAYGREDVLLNKLGFDNSEFLKALDDRGFYVAGCSQSNYAFTQFSLSSSLNYKYLDNLAETQRSARVAALKHSAVRSFLEANGYKVVAFPTGFNFSELTDADLYLDFEHSASNLTEFEDLFLNTTLLRVAIDMRGGETNIDTSLHGALKRLRTLSALDNLKKLHTQNVPLFVFAHLIVPHPPYSFGPNGENLEFTDKAGSFEEARTGYINQVKFINHEILKVVDVIIAGSKTPPVIIIQGDHGPLPDLSPTYLEKMPILNAYYLPNIQAEKALYPSISPVNTFRVILNSYFGQTLPLLEDRSYYAPSVKKEFQLVPNTCPSNP